MIPININDMKQIEMKIVDEIQRICEEHELQYFLAYGSLIGAARHQGFIPWDDDMDLHMFRQDYETFVLHFDEWKSTDRFSIASPVLGNSFFFGTKIIDTTTLVNQPHVSEKYQHGVWVDIFPLDNYHPSLERKFFKIKLLGILRYLASTDPQSDSASPFSAIIKHILCPLMQHLSAEKLSARMDKWSKELCTLETDTVATIPGIMSPGKYSFKKEWFSPMQVQFEDRLYVAPTYYNEILTTRYGDWKTPIEQKPHSVDAFKLNSINH